MDSHSYRLFCNEVWGQKRQFYAVISYGKWYYLEKNDL